MAAMRSGPPMALLVATLAWFATFSGASEAAEGIELGVPPLGKVRGTLVVRTDLDVEYFAFFGVPYARPPVGPLRFMPPEPLKTPFTDRVFDATSPDAPTMRCIQLPVDHEAGVRRPPAVGQEDCLVLNIFLPKQTGLDLVDLADDGKGKDDLLPVMVWLVGEGPFTSSRDPGEFGPDYFFAPDRPEDPAVIVVTVNYRLGPFGFLSFESGLLPGNMGLQDQGAALGWLNRHLRSFGGDPDRVTLCGWSSGSAAVPYHMASPGSRTLFSSAIMQSGAAIGWVPNLRLSGNASEYAFNLALEAGCDDEAPEQVLLCLQRAEPETLAELGSMFDTYLFAGSPWKPVVGGQFMPRSLEDAMASGAMSRIPVLIGSTENEAALLMPHLARNNFSRLRDLAETFQESGPHLLLGVDKDSVDDRDTATANILKIEYFSGQNLSRDNADILQQLLTDVLYLAPVDAQIQSLVSYYAATAHEVGSSSPAGTPPIYSYIFRHRGGVSRTPRSAEGWPESAAPWEGGAGHGDDVLLLFRQASSELESQKTAEDRQVSKRMVRMWKSFASGRPPQDDDDDGPWPPTSTSGHHYHLIGGDPATSAAYSRVLRSRLDFVDKMMKVHVAFRNMDVFNHPAVRESAKDREMEDKEQQDWQGHAAAAADDNDDGGGPTILESILNMVASKDKFASDEESWNNLGSGWSLDSFGRDEL